jgi:hypothetical protein
VPGVGARFVADLQALSEASGIEKGVFAGVLNLGEVADPLKHIAAIRHRMRDRLLLQ